MSVASRIVPTSVTAAAVIALVVGAASLLAAAMWVFLSGSNGTSPEAATIAKLTGLVDLLVAAVLVLGALLSLTGYRGAWVVMVVGASVDLAFFGIRAWILRESVDAGAVLQYGLPFAVADATILLLVSRAWVARRTIAVRTHT